MKIKRTMTILGVFLLVLWLTAAVGRTATAARSWPIYQPPGMSVPPAQDGAGADLPAGWATLKAAAGGAGQLTLHPSTGVVRFFRTDPAAPLALSGADPAARANAFFTTYGAAFGVRSPAELTQVKADVDALGFTHLTFTQQYGGLPVFGAILHVHFNAAGELYGVNGVFIPNLNLDVTPGQDTAAAAAAAVAAVEPWPLTGTEPPRALNTTLMIYREGLVQGLAGGVDRLVYEVAVGNERDVREFVYVDAQSGRIVDQFSGLHNTINRRLYDPTLTGANLQWSEGDPFPTGNSDWNNELNGAMESYNLVASMTNGAYLSYDGADAMMITVNDDPAIACPNANWNGISTNYCTDVSGDDTVAHEWGHAYTEYTHNLIYAWQPGALNESYSDIWGESVDLLNGRGLDSPGPTRTPDTCVPVALEGANFPGWPTENSVRWLSGEDDPAFDAIPAGSGYAIRDMWAPACFGDPERVTDSNYHCDPSDGGGVHTNSGVPNHAFALMVDGGTYNGQTVTGLGLVKALHIYWRAQTVYQTDTSDFADHADALEASCADLIGINLLQPVTTGPGTWGTLSGQSISAGDCQEVTDAINAVELRVAPTQCYFEPMLNASLAACGTTEQGAVAFSEDFEGVTAPALPAGWSVATRNAAGTFTAREWTSTATLPDGRGGQGVFGPDPIIGDCAGNNEDGVIQLFSPAIDTTGLSNVQLSFDHYMASEMNWDGGNLSVNVNGGGWQLIQAGDIVVNSYNGTLSGSPMAGQAAYTGANGGSVSGSWGTTTVDLSAYATPGDSIEIVWELGTDECNGQDGWYVDDVRVHECGLCGNFAVDAGEACDDGNFVNGDGCSDSCQVEFAYASCTAPSSSTAPINDGSFEAGIPNPNWDDNWAGTGEDTIYNGTPNSDGSWHAYFHAKPGGYVYSRNVSQAITIPSGAQTLNFDFRAQACAYPSYTEFNMLIGWSSRYRVVSGDPECGAGSYSTVQIDVRNFADGGTHLIAFDGVTVQGFGFNDRFHVDNVTLTSTAPSVCSTFTADYSDLDATYSYAWHEDNGDGGAALRLGTLLTFDGPAATLPAQDADNASDDGVTQGAGAWGVGSNVMVDVTVGNGDGDDFLACWFDWDGDGAFAGAEKGIASGVVDGANSLPLAIPAGYDVNTNPVVDLRCRLYETEPLVLRATEAPDGGAVGGEVEDYRWDLTPAPTAIRLGGLQTTPVSWLPALALLLGLLAVLLWWRRSTA